jgi:hypothetical protein
MLVVLSFFSLEWLKIVNACNQKRIYSKQMIKSNMDNYSELVGNSAGGILSILTKPITEIYTALG